MSALPSDIPASLRHACFVPTPEIAVSFDHLVGLSEEPGPYL